MNPLESKKWSMGALGMILVIISGAGAALAGPAGIAVLPYVVGGIVTLAGGQMLTQGTADAIQEANKPKTIASINKPEIKD